MCTCSTEHPQKGPHVDEPSHAPGESSCASHRSPSRSMSMSELEDHGSFTVPTSSSTPNKLWTQLHPRSSSTDSRFSMTPDDAGLYNSFSHYGPPGFSRGGTTPMASIARSQHVSNSMWQPPGLIPCTCSLPTGKLNAEQSTEIFNLAAECQALSTELAKQFQRLSRLEVVHHATAQATAHETINVGQMAQDVAYSLLQDDQTWDKKCEETLQQLRTEADKAWKDTNDLVFNHQLRYDGQLVAFISHAERALHEKRNKVWECVHRLTDMAGISHNACLGLALQVLDKLPTIPKDLSYHTLIPMMLAYGPESYAYQTWCKDGGETSSLGKGPPAC